MWFLLLYDVQLSVVAFFVCLFLRFQLSACCHLLFFLRFLLVLGSFFHLPFYFLHLAGSLWLELPAAPPKTSPKPKPLNHKNPKP